MAETTGVRCKGCGTQLEDLPLPPSGLWPPCPNGSVNRCFNKLLVALPVHAKAGFYAMHSGKRHREGPGAKKKRLRREFKIGDTLFRKDGRWYFMEQIVDHENDLYWKRIIDRLTGHVFLFRHERLRQHRGHGSAKKKT
jgi:hypothetical protein